MEEENKKNQNNTNFLAISILIAAVLISGSIFYTKNPNTAKNTGGAQIAQNQIQQPQPTLANLNDVLKIKNSDVILGDPNAKVTIIEYGDFECPFCKRFFDETEPLLIKNYIETGKAKMIYRDFPLPGHQHAMPSALAANCAKEQGKFWPFHNEIFKNQESLATLDYINLAEKLGLSTSNFKTCLENKKYLDQIQKEYNEAQSIGVNGTPTFFINGKQIVGAQPYNVFKQAIEQELK